MILPIVVKTGHLVRPDPSRVGHLVS